MTRERIDFFARMTKEEKEGLSSEDFTVSEFKEIISETALNDTEKMIVIHRYIDCMTFEEIASVVGIDLRTCRTKLSRIDEKLKHTYIKLFYK